MGMGMESLISFKKDNGPNLNMGDNVGEDEPIDEAMDDNEDIDPDFPNILNEKLHWKEDQPILGMRFENAKQLKHVLFSCVVTNGYQLSFVKNNSRRLLAKCCDEKYIFRVWGSWMSDEKSF